MIEEGVRRAELTRWNRSWPPGLSEREIAEFVEDNEASMRVRMFCEPALASVAGLAPSRLTRSTTL